MAVGRSFAAAITGAVVMLVPALAADHSASATGWGARRQLASWGYLVPHPAAYARAKATLAARWGGRGAASAFPARAAPSATKTWTGLHDPRTTPPDPTGAVGPKRYVQLVNSRFAIFRRDGRRLSSGDIGVLTGLGRNFPYLTDPQVIWDPATRRFYYVVLDFDIAYRNTSDGIDFAFGFSKTGSPSTPRDWCKYALSFGYDRPSRNRYRVVDQPHLGDTRGFLLWGGNVFDVSTFVPRYRGSDVDWVRKPKAGKACPRGKSLRLGAQHKLRTASGRLAFTPVVAAQADPSRTGWVVATPNLPTARSSARALSLFRITTSRSGDAVIGARGRSVRVPSYAMPPPAPQAGSRYRLDTLDARLLQAVAAVDPSKHRVAVWTQHTVRGGAGSIVRWYEIDPEHRGLFQRGSVSDPALYAFNGAVSSDRVVRPGVRRFGGSMVLGFDTSSQDRDVAVQMVSKVGSRPQSSFVRVKRSFGPDVDVSCRRDPACRWGDFAGASPDPAAPVNGSHGSVWLTNMWNVPNKPGMDWRTIVWKARP
jgi:hypothetical protein